MLTSPLKMIAGFVQETMRLHAIFQVEFGRVCTITETAAMRRLLFFCRSFFFRSVHPFHFFFFSVLFFGLVMTGHPSGARGSVAGSRAFHSLLRPCRRSFMRRGSGPPLHFYGRERVRNLFDSFIGY